MNYTSQTNRLILSVLAVVVGLFMVIVTTLLIQTSLDWVVSALREVSKEKLSYASGIMLFTFAYPLTNFLSMCQLK